MGRAIVLVDDEFIREVLHVPADIRIRGVTFDAMRNCVVVHLEGAALPEVERNTEPPLIWPHVTARRERNAQGEWEHRVDVTWPIPSGEIGTVTHDKEATQP